MSWDDMVQYCYNWKEDLSNILQFLRNKLKRDCLLWDITPTEVPVKGIYERCKNFPYPEYEEEVPRKILIGTSECFSSGFNQNPCILYVRRDRDGSYSFEEHCAYSVRWPDFYEIIGDVIRPFDSQCEEAVAAVFDVGCFHTEDDFREDLLWVFHDNGQELTCYSGEFGLKKLIEFWEAAMPQTSPYPDAVHTLEVSE